MKNVIALLTLLTLGALTAHAEDHHEMSPFEDSYLADGREILAAPNHMTVYSFDLDVTSESTCYDACAKAWPPVLYVAGTELGSDVGTTTRKDGSLQLTYQGQPMYYFAKDEKPTDIKGDGLGGVWHIVILE